MGKKKCKNILRALLRIRFEDAYLVYEGVSLGDYYYILDRVESDKFPKARNKHFRLSFFRNSQRLVISSPSGVHKSVLNLVTRKLWRILDIPVPGDILYLDIWFNSDRPSESIDAIPDLVVKMWSRMRESPCHLPRILWLMESASSQSDDVVMDKLRAYVRDVPELLVVGKLLIKEETPYHSPGSRGSNVKRLRSSKWMTQSEWSSICGDSQEYDYARVVADGYTWFSLSSVELHLWIRKPGESKIDLDSLSGDGYAFGRLYPTLDLDDVDNAFRRGLELTKATILDLNIPDVDLSDWVLPTCVIEPEDCVGALMRGAWTTAYGRYCDWWYEKQKKSRYSSNRSGLCIA